MHDGPKKRWYEYVIDSIDVVDLVTELGGALVELLANVLAGLFSLIAGLFS